MHWNWILCTNISININHRVNHYLCKIVILNQMFTLNIINKTEICNSWYESSMFYFSVKKKKRNWRNWGSSEYKILFFSFTIHNCSFKRCKIKCVLTPIYTILQYKIKVICHNLSASDHKHSLGIKWFSLIANCSNSKSAKQFSATPGQFRNMARHVFTRAA